MYTHGEFEVIIPSAAANLASAAVIGEWGPGYRPVTVKAVALLITTAPNAAGVVELNHRPVKGSASNEVQVVELSVIDASVAGTVLYANGLDLRVNPGESVAFEVTDATPTAGVAQMIIVYERESDNPAALAKMVDAKVVA